MLLIIGSVYLIVKQNRTSYLEDAFGAIRCRHRAIARAIAQIKLIYYEII